MRAAPLCRRSDTMMLPGSY